MIPPKTVGYLTFGRDDLAYGLAAVIADAQKALPNTQFVRVTPRTARLVDVLAFSLFWWEHIWALADFLRKAGISKAQTKRPRIIVGGFNSFNPVNLACYADIVVCGDGEDGAFLAALLDQDHPSIYRGSGTVRWANVPCVPRLHVTNDVARIEIARGCKARCKFCQVAHLKPYREADPDKVFPLLLEAKRKGVKRASLFAPEPTMHPHNRRFTAACQALGLSRVDSDVRLDRLEYRDVAVPRVGLEGLSERLRRSVGKYISNEKVISKIKTLIESGRHCVHIYLILDLPGETEDDWREFRELLQAIGRIPGAEKLVLKPTPAMFLPSPFTPWEAEPIHWDRDYRTQWQQFFGTGENRTWDVLMAERNRVFAPEARVLAMIAVRAGQEFADVERALSSTGALVVDNDGRPHVTDRRLFLSCLQPFGGPERWTGVPREMPWHCLTLSHR